MTKEKLISVIEGILFAWSEPVSLKDLSKVLNISKAEVKNIIEFMKINYEKDSSGLRLITLEDSYQLSTKPENYEYISEFVSNKNKKNLSNPSLETLAIIAYKQPVTKIEIEEIRGVKCDATLKSLVELNLVEITGQLEKIGRPNIYETTSEFLKKFGLSSIKDLPKIEEDEQISMTFLEE